MMEQVDRAGQEEFIWAMRTRTLMPHEEDADSWKGRSTQGTLFEESQTKIYRRSEASQEDHTKILASLVPDEIIYNCNDYAPRDYEACLLFGDVSGFTDLCEKYNQEGKGGPSRLTQVLNTYIGTMVQEIMSYNGDVLKFSGDAFLAMWKTDINNSSMQDCVHQALDCALIIQKTHGKYETDVGVFLRVKLAIAAGQVVFSIIGDIKMSHYVVIGSPIWDVKAGEKCAVAGEIICSQSAWDYINPTEYQFEYMGDSIHIKVLGLTQNWRSTQKTMGRDEYTTDVNISPDESLNSVRSPETTTENEVFELRPSVGDAVKLGLKEDLRKYILPPIMRGIDMDEPIEYLTEMRHIVIIFINVVTLNVEVHEYVRIVDQCYKIVCNIVDSMEGCVNKVSLFDKDLMFVIIFGLRGFKHELESQRGLKCARECFTNIQKVEHVVSTSVAVTTGMTYCGAVGHTLRREYTVISITVNKAARLMVAYPNKVTCDRDTFLQSKLEARCFVLQEYRPLKGIKKVGPVYEFVDFDKSLTASKYTVNTYPILDREKEITTYLKLLKQLKSLETCCKGSKATFERALLIFGNARQGKTRLCEEFLFVTPPDIPVYRIKLWPSDKNIPYQTVYQILSVPLGINENSTLEDKQTKLLTKMCEMPVPELLGLLNEIFQVNFAISRLVKVLSQSQKAIALKKTIKQLVYRLLNILWVVIIDDADNIDDESWSLIEAIMETQKLFIVLTLSTDSKLSLEASNFIKNPTLKTMTLNPIDKWYHIGLACQILNVYGITPEVEKVLHTKSNGNPGWIESFLISLVQGNLVEIKNVALDLLDEYGVVTPPKEMMSRGSPPSASLDQSDELIIDSTAILNEKWRIYKQSFKDSMTKIDQAVITQKQIPRVGSTIMVNICLTIEGEDITDVDAELSLDVFIMKIFDSLSSYEQLLLKCGAVIGEQFPRDMLIYLMNSQEDRSMGLAVKKLFEIGVIGCVRVDVLEQEFKELISSKNNQAESVECYCIGLHIPVYNHNLPKYASCANMRFKLPYFRETTYNLLTVNQKKEFHSRAVRYLEKHTRKCGKCGGGFFVKILGIRYDENFKRKKKTARQLRTTASISSTSILENWDHNLRKQSLTNLNTQKLEKGKSLTVPEETTETAQIEQDSSKSFESGNDRFSTFQAVQKLRYRESLLRSFSSTNFSNCECPQVLSNMYRQIREHCKATDQIEKWMNATLEYSFICIQTYNIPLMLKLLGNALEVLDKQYQTIVKPKESWRIPFIRAKILSLIGKGRLILGQLKPAYKALEMALKYYGFKFPGRSSLKFSILQMKQMLMLYCMPRLGIGTKEGYTAEYCDNLSDCLASMCKLFMELGMWVNAESAAMWSLQKALESEKDFPTVVTAFANMITTSIRNRKMNLIVALEVRALLFCKRYTAAIEVKDLKAVSLLYASIFTARVVRGELQKSIDIGTLYNNIANSVNSPALFWEIFPLFIEVLLYRNKILDAISLIVNFEKNFSLDHDSNGVTWIYALAIGIHLNTGFQVMPFEQCENYFYSETKNIATNGEVNAEKRFYTVIWLWYLRVENYEEAEIWKEKLSTFKITKTECLVNLITGLYYLEGLILTTAYKMDRKMIFLVKETFSETEKMIATLEYHSKYIKIIAPRLYHLKAFYNLTKTSDADVSAMISLAKKLSRQTGNMYEENWITHSEMAWQQNMSSITYTFWKDHATQDCLHYSEFENNDKLGFFTLEPPLYV